MKTTTPRTGIIATLIGALSLLILPVVLVSGEPAKAPAKAACPAMKGDGAAPECKAMWDTPKHPANCCNEIFAEPKHPANCGEEMAATPKHPANCCNRVFAEPKHPANCKEDLWTIDPAAGCGVRVVAKADLPKGSCK